MYNLSFDIGKVNLAYCLTHYMDNKLEIVHWNLVNIQPQACTNCKKRAVYQIDNLYYCSTHKKLTSGTSITKLPKAESNFVEQANILFSFLDALYELLKRPYNIVFKSFTDYQFIKPSNINVYIENQLGMANGGCKSIAVMIYTYFKTRIDNDLIASVSFISASVKTSKPFLSQYFNDIPDLKGCKNTAQRKEIIVNLTFKLLKTPSTCPWTIINKITFFTNFKKRDDLADSYIYCLIKST